MGLLIPRAETSATHAPPKTWNKIKNMPEIKGRIALKRLMSRRSNCNFETKEAFSQTKWLFSCLISDYESFTFTLRGIYLDDDSHPGRTYLAAFKGKERNIPTLELKGPINGILLLLAALDSRDY